MAVASKSGRDPVPSPFDLVKNMGGALAIADLLKQATAEEKDRRLRVCRKCIHKGFWEMAARDDGFQKKTDLVRLKTGLARLIGVGLATIAKLLVADDEKAIKYMGRQSAMTVNKVGSFFGSLYEEPVSGTIAEHHVAYLLQKMPVQVNQWNSSTQVGRSPQREPAQFPPTPFGRPHEKPQFVPAVIAPLILPAKMNGHGGIPAAMRRRQPCVPAPRACRRGEGRRCWPVARPTPGGQSVLPRERLNAPRVAAPAGLQSLHACPPLAY